MKAHFGVDSRTKVIHAVVATPANVADSTVLPDLLHGKETRVWGDQAYPDQRVVIRQHAPKAQDLVNRRYRHRGVVDEVERAKNRIKCKVRARVEHAIGVIKRVFGSAKVHYRGVKKNTHRLLVICALVICSWHAGIYCASKRPNVSAIRPSKPCRHAMRHQRGPITLFRSPVSTSLCPHIPAPCSDVPQRGFTYPG